MIKSAEIAKQINSLMLECGEKLDASVQLVKENCTEQEFQAYRKAVGSLMGVMLLDIMNPIYKTHPSLKPAELG